VPDTIRSADAFLNASTGLFKDNTAGDIGANDLRDFTLSTYRPQGFAGGRLTLTTATPVTSSDVTAASTLYYTPYLHDLIGMPDSGSSWTLRTFSELSLSLSGLTSGKLYDVWIFDSSGTLTLELSGAWTNDTTRADAVALLNGTFTKSGATSRRWLGTIRATGTTTTELSATKQFVWNAYNRVRRPVERRETAASWTNSTASLRSLNNSTSNRIEVVCGMAGWSQIVATAVAASEATNGKDCGLAIGEDSTTTGLSAEAGMYGMFSNSVTLIGSLSATVRRQVPLGYHYYQALEYGNTGTITFYGSRDAGAYPPIGTGIFGEYES
jgi:hypothetical protein